MSPTGDLNTYPAHREADVALRDGSTVHIRPVRSGDEADLLAFFRSLSPEARHMRFFTHATDSWLAREAHRESQVDYVRTFGLLAMLGSPTRIVGQATYAALDGDRAEVAFAIADEAQGRGLGTILLGHLAEVATANQIQVFEAYVLPQNQRMLEVFRESGFPIEVKAAPGELRVIFPTAVTPEALEHFEQRERIAATNAMKAFFTPRSVAVLGASRRRGTVGGEILHNLVAFGFAGRVDPVNPAAATVQSLPAYPSILAVPDPVDLAVVVVPADQVAAVAAECGRKGVRALVVISAGFAETGAEGRARQAELLRICRDYGMRLIGPNCMGIVNTDPSVRLNATFAPQPPPEGRIGFSSQSGALGLAIIDHAGSLGLGLSTFVSVGNKADISGNDLLRYWESDPRTDVILLYLESFGNPQAFSRIARRIGRSKPIAVVKSGRSRAGTRATTSHTGALLAASDVTVDALFRQSGVIRTDTLEELFDVAALLGHQPVPKGRRVGIVTNAGGPAILCADACEAEGLEVPLLTEASQAGLRALLPKEASVGNPVDMIASAPAEHYRKAIEIVSSDPNVDALVVIFIPPLATRAEDVARAIVDGARSVPSGKPILTVFMSARGVPPELRSAGVRIPSYAFPEDAAIALARVARYGEWQHRPASAAPVLQGLHRMEATRLVASALSRGGGWLDPGETAALLSFYGLSVLPQRIVEEAAEAAEAAAELGPEVAVKVIAPGLVHKTESGGVRLHLRGADDVRQAVEDMRNALRTQGIVPTGFLVQPMAPAGVEMILGVVHDPQFGPVVAVGAGGVMVELLKDVSIRLAPLTREDAAEMITGLRSYPLLTGFRGAPPGDIGALTDALMRVGTLADDLPQIAELDCNPVMVHSSGISIVDARVRVAPIEPPRPLSARR